MYSQMEFVSDKRVFEGFKIDACLGVPLDVKIGDVRLKWCVDFSGNRIPHPSNACPFPQFTFLQKDDTHEKHFDQSYLVIFHSFPNCKSPNQIKNLKKKSQNVLNKTGISLTKICYWLRETADLFYCDFDLLQLRFSAQYWPWDVQSNKPHAVWPLHISTHIARESH